MKPCRWVSRDEQGRPSCEHGSAIKAGTHWRCPLKKYLTDRRYDRSEKGREAMARSNARPGKQSTKALYELTRIRVGG